MGSRLLVAVGLSLACVAVCSALTTPAYTAASVQFNTIVDKHDLVGSLMSNVERMVPYMEEAAKGGADIIVFPELSLGVDELDRKNSVGLGSIIPPTPASPLVNPCEQASAYNATMPAVVAASCAAKANGLYAVIGLIAKEACNASSVPPCPHDGWYLYNSALVIDKDGNLISLEHKYHIEFTLTHIFNIPATPQRKSFNTSFGVTFGQFICFDILFKDPAEDLVDEGLRHFVFPTSWTQVPPIVTANQIQQAWSRHYDTVLIAANNALSADTSGSGIYVSGSPLTYYFNYTLKGNADEKFMIADIPALTWDDAVPRGPSAVAEAKAPVAPKGGVAFSSCGVIPGDCDIFVPKAGATGMLKASSNHTSCTANFTISEDYAPPDGKREHYALFATDAMIYFSQEVPIQACGIIHCVDDLLCIIPDPLLRKIYEGYAVFDHLRIDSNLGGHPTLWNLVGTRGGQLLAPDAVSFADGTLSMSGVTEAIIDATMLVGSWDQNITLSR